MYFVSKKKHKIPVQKSKNSSKEITVYKNDLESIRKKIMKSKYIAITVHNSPDGDAIGSALALGLAISAVKRTAHIFIRHMSTSFQTLSSYLLDEEQHVSIQRYAQFNYDLTILVDCSERERTILDLERLSKYLIVIDHHANRKPIGNIYYYEDQPACAMIIYKLIKSFTKITPKIATAIYTGIFGDTSGFRNNNVNEFVHQISAELIQKGAEFILVHQLYSMYHMSAVKLLGKVLNHLVFDEKYRIIYAVASRDEIILAKATYEEASLIIDYIKNIYEADIAILFIESANAIWIRARTSTDDINVAEILKDFNGGGHQKAAGAQINSINLYGIIEEVLYAARSYLEKYIIVEDDFKEDIKDSIEETDILEVDTSLEKENK